jgi:exopolysaccharide biosynthesis polyprenyl glycosylphosphotransferase
MSTFATTTETTADRFVRAAEGFVPRRPAAVRRDRSLTAVLMAGDAAAFAAAVVVSGSPAWAFLLVPIGLLALTSRGLHRPRGGSALDVFGGSITSAGVATGALLLGGALLSPSSLPAGPLAHAFLLSAVLLCAQRAVAVVRRRTEPGEPTVVLGGGEAGDNVLRALQSNPGTGLRPVARFETDLSSASRTADARGLARLAREAGGREVVLVPGEASDAAVGQLARACAAEGLGVSVRTSAADAGGALAVDHVGPLSLVRVRPVTPHDWRFALKHAFDRAFAVLGLLAVAPVFAGLALAVRISSPGPIFYRQRRVGRDGREFDMLKFRSMRVAPAQPVVSLRLPAGIAPGGVEGDDRRTAIGSLLRRTSLDELPQLLNVLTGDMSLVGPRPERPEYVDRFVKDVDRYGDRHRIKSGMTGLAQVNGLRGKTSIADRVAYDNHYVEQWSPWLDAKILLRTVLAVFQPAE